jgi:Spy/CpxP family protein refolding chaperone
MRWWEVLSPYNPDPYVSPDEEYIDISELESRLRVQHPPGSDDEGVVAYSLRIARTHNSKLREVRADRKRNQKEQYAEAEAAYNESVRNNGPDDDWAETLRDWRKKISNLPS